jgi:hypothetical protein
MIELRRGNSDPARELFLGRYRRLIFAAIRHYAQDYDDMSAGWPTSTPPALYCRSRVRTRSPSYPSSAARSGV